MTTFVCNLDFLLFSLLLSRFRLIGRVCWLQTDLWIPHRKQHTRRTVFNHRPHLSSYMQKRHLDGRERSGGGGRAGGAGGENK